MPEFTEFPIPRKDVEDLTSQQQEDVRVALGLPAATQAEALAGTEPESRTFSPALAWFAGAAISTIQYPTTGVTAITAGSGSVTEQRTSTRASTGSTADSKALVRFASAVAIYGAIPGNGDINISAFRRRGAIAANMYFPTTSASAATRGLSVGHNLDATDIDKTAGSRIGWEIRGTNNTPALWRINNNDYADIVGDSLGSGVRSGRFILTWDGAGNIALYRYTGAPLVLEHLLSLSGAPVSVVSTNWDVLFESKNGGSSASASMDFGGILLTQ